MLFITEQVIYTKPRGLAKGRIPSRRSFPRLVIRHREWSEGSSQKKSPHQETPLA